MECKGPKGALRVIECLSLFVLCVYVYTHQTDQIVLFKCGLFSVLQL